MSGSYESINYSLRPAKAIERKMLSEAMQCLSSFRDVRSYRYVGFGSTYFSDFQLFHRNLGLTDMVSIERDVHKTARFEFNKPYDCIRMSFKEAKHAIPEVIVEGVPSIVWLDYDGSMDSEVLADIKSVATLLAPSSMLIYSVNAHPANCGTDASRLGSLKASVGEQRVPADVAEKDLASWGTAATFRRIAHNEILESLTARNAPRPSGAKLVYKQVFNFNYADGAKMLTAGGVLLDEGTMSHFGSSGLDRLSFYRDGVDPYQIRVPSLTYRELRHLDKALPGSTPPDTLGIPTGDVETYRNIYRYFPSFSEIH